MEEMKKMKEKILLVDDDPDICSVLKISLTDNGYRVHIAKNGVEAFRLFKQIRPAIVITDIVMPDMNGLELLCKIKAVNPETEVIMISGHGELDMAIKSLQNDASDFILKPISDASLHEAIQKSLEKISLHKQLSILSDLNTNKDM